MAGAIRDFKGTADGEWAIENGDLAVVEGAEAIPQGIRVRLQMFKGECYLNESAGVDYIDRILVKNTDPLVVRALLSEAISDTPDVVTVIAAQLVQEEGTRNASISYQCDTTYSEIPLTEQVDIP